MAKFKPGQSGNPAGRPPGPSKKQLADLVAEKFPSYDPILALIEVALDQETPLDMRVRCHSEVAPFIRPRLRMLDATFGGMTLQDLVEASMRPIVKVITGMPEVEAERDAPAPTLPRIATPVEPPSAPAPAPVPAERPPAPVRLRPIRDEEPERYATGEQYKPRYL